jgi:hypothetical protein
MPLTTHNGERTSHEAKNTAGAPVLLYLFSLLLTVMLAKKPSGTFKVVTQSEIYYPFCLYWQWHHENIVPSD